MGDWGNSKKDWGWGKTSHNVYRCRGKDDCQLSGHNLVGTVARPYPLYPAAHWSRLCRKAEAGLRTPSFQMDAGDPPGPDTRLRAGRMKEKKNPRS